MKYKTVKAWHCSEALSIEVYVAEDGYVVLESYLNCQMEAQEAFQFDSYEQALFVVSELAAKRAFFRAAYSALAVAAPLVPDPA